MLLEDLVESRRTRLDRRRIAFLPIVIAIHAVFVGILIISSVWSVTYIEEPPLQVTLFAAPPPPPPAARPARTPQAQQAQQPKPQPQVQAEVAPITIPEYTPEILPAETVSEADVVQGVEGGIDWGVEGGVEGGVPGGIPGGIPGGVPGGIPGGGPVRVETVGGTPPKPLAPIQCMYPEAARRLRLEGIVILEAIILKDGTVGSIRTLRSLNELLDQAAMDCLRSYRFEPGKINGRPVDSYYVLTVRYTLQGG
jgi:protein TonB